MFTLSLAMRDTSPPPHVNATHGHGVDGENGRTGTHIAAGVDGNGTAIQGCDGAGIHIQIAEKFAIGRFPTGRISRGGEVDVGSVLKNAARAKQAGEGISAADGEQAHAFGGNPR